LVSVANRVLAMEEGAAGAVQGVGDTAAVVVCIVWL
jgi:hypothetical protein